jgi:hypothetical protein
VRPSWSPLPHHRTGLGSLPASSKRHRISGPDADSDGSVSSLSVRKRTEATAPHAVVTSKPAAHVWPVNRHHRGLSSAISSACEWTLNRSKIAAR